MTKIIHTEKAPAAIGPYVQAVDKRSKTLYQTELLNQAQDPYVTFREAYYQNLEFKVNDGKVKEGSQKELSDDVLKEID